MAISKNVKWVRVNQAPGMGSGGGSLRFTNKQRVSLNVSYRRTGEWFELESSIADQLDKSGAFPFVEVSEKNPNPKPKPKPKQKKED